MNFDEDKNESKNNKIEKIQLMPNAGRHEHKKKAFDKFKNEEYHSSD